MLVKIKGTSEVESFKGAYLDTRSVGRSSRSEWGTAFWYNKVTAPRSGFVPAEVFCATMSLCIKDLFVSSAISMVIINISVIGSPVKKCSLSPLKRVLRPV